LVIKIERRRESQPDLRWPGYPLLLTLRRRSERLVQYRNGVQFNVSPSGNRTMLGFQSRFEIQKTIAFLAAHRGWLEEFTFPADCQTARNFTLPGHYFLAGHCCFSDTKSRAGHS
jgi:hypothetical protein